MKRSPLKRTTVLARGSGRLKVRRRRAAGTVEQREAFKLAVCHEGAFCAVTDDGPCEGRLEAHHVVPREWLRRQARYWGWTDAQLGELLWDPANGLSVCGRHHRRHTLAVRRIPLAALTPQHCAFVHDLGADVLIERSYRLREDVAA